MITMVDDDDDKKLVADELVEPLWYRYAICTRGSSDKFYEVRIDMDDTGNFVLTKRWGRRPDFLDNGQQKVESYGALQSAITEANRIFQAKLDNEYVVADRPSTL